MRAKATAMPDERFGYRSWEIASGLGIDSQTWTKLWQSGQAPPPDIRHKRLHVWRKTTIDAWLASQSPDASNAS